MPSLPPVGGTSEMSECSSEKRPVDLSMERTPRTSSPSSVSVPVLSKQQTLTLPPMLTCTTSSGLRRAAQRKERTEETYSVRGDAKDAQLAEAIDCESRPDGKRRGQSWRDDDGDEVECSHQDGLPLDLKRVKTR